MSDGQNDNRGSDTNIDRLIAVTKKPRRKCVGIDLHGVLDENPAMSAALIAMHSMGIEIHILSGPPLKQIKKELKELDIFEGLHYDHIMSVVDYLKAKKVKMWKDENGDWWAEDEDWWASKGQYCEENGIDVVIDNNEEYAEYMPKKTMFILVG